MRLKGVLVLSIITSALFSVDGCADRDPVKPQGQADVQSVGDPVRSTLATANYIVERSFGGSEFIIVDPSRNYDPAYIDELWALDAISGFKFAIYRYADYAWEGLVKNQGDLAADNVYVRITFAGGFIDSAYVRGHKVRPNETIDYLLYSRGDRVDQVEFFWQDVAEE